ncbi:alpha/beta hydrolase family protein [Aureimonas ureilytica]|uniref:alpha/beta hydrolase family protein n=1 Tax=Aureimonas ureilytica TaxID=401562 RepID=UPI00035F293E|nr:alpha/beta fold hydrolase [Aureimonas ureilytica]
MVSDASPTDAPRAVDGPRRIEMRCEDGVCLGGDLWTPTTGPLIGQVIVNCATGVLSRYYHRYARFLASHGFVVLTYDYRGIGLSRPERLRRCGYRWRDWGQKDFEAALATMIQAHSALPLAVVGHSVGGFLPGLAKGASRIDRMLTVGAQYAWHGDYAPARRRRLIWKWHVVMPALAVACGYFPGRRLGWLEDLPKGVALEWACRRASFERNHPVAERERVLAGMEAVRAPILAVVISDDELGTVAAVHRTLSYYEGADRTMVLLDPSDFGRDAVGHFALFHDRYADSFWLRSLEWLRDGRNPWPEHVAFAVHNGRRQSEASR